MNLQRDRCTKYCYKLLLYINPFLGCALTRQGCALSHNLSIYFGASSLTRQVKGKLQNNKLRGP
jgi:hypothetical protein